MTATNSRSLIIEWGDCDPAGIVFYPRYFAMFDTSTTRLIESVTGMRKADLIRAHDIIGWPMVKTEASFASPASFGDEITISTSVAAVGRSSFRIAHSLFNKTILCIEASETRVWAGADPDKPGAIRGLPIPDDVAAALRG